MTRKYIFLKVVFALVFVSVQNTDIENVENDKRRGDSLTSYFEKYAQMLASSKDVVETRSEIEDTNNFEKRSNSPPSGFENIERNYLISQCTKFLKEFIGIAQKANNDTETRAHLEHRIV